MLGIVGISYKSAPLGIREQFSFSEHESLQFLKQLKLDLDVMGAIVLSTCNRIEVYFHIEKCCPQKAFDFIFRNLEYFTKKGELPKQYFYSYMGDQAINHLFRVVSGVESLIIGEDQIVTQVKNAFKLSLDNDLSSPPLTRMFNKSFEASKRVRTETSINQGTASISSAAVDLICRRTKDFPQRNIVLIGMGVMGQLALTNLVKRNCRSISITNRTFEKSQQLAKKYDLDVFEFEKLPDHIQMADVVIVATGAPNHIITGEMIRECCQQRKERQIFMDLSVPRNISTDVGQRENTELYAVDDLQEIVKETQQKRKEAVAEAAEIIQIVQQEFTDWLNSLQLTPSILKIKKNIDSVNHAELEGFLKINGIKDDEMLTRYADHIAGKYSRLFIRNLKHVTQNGKQREYLDILNQLFELTD
ncbi:MAG: glutamyl-tRNA reductase [Bacteroidales bacterium]